MALTTQEILDKINEAIEALLTGDHQSYSIGARSVTRLDLKALMEERRLLQTAVQREAGNVFRLAKIMRPST